MTNNLRDEIARREKICEAATPGWRRALIGGLPNYRGNVEDAQGDTVAGNGRGGNDREWIAQGDRNLDFIAHARTGYPETLEALRIALETLEIVSSQLELQIRKRCGSVAAATVLVLQNHALVAKRAALAQIAGRLGGGA